MFAADNDGTSTTTYEWDNWDYYEILGLDRNAEYSEKEIKKAYRKQAQQWHPDKADNNKSNKTTKQESNDRFARIAEAYQVLTKEKQEYDKFLRRRVNQKFDGFSHTSNDEGGYYSDDLYAAPPRDYYEPVDPWAVFQEFFGDLYSNHMYARGESYHSSGSFDDGYGSHTHRSSQRIRTRTPDRFWEEEEFFVNDYGQTIVRKIQTSSYFFEKEEGFLQTVAQDYAPRQQDLYTGEWFYHPLQDEPVVLQEGIFEFVYDTSWAESISGSIPRFMDPSALWPDVTLVKGSQMRTGPYVVELSSDCDLTSYRENIINADEPHLLWSLRESGQIPLYVNSVSDCRLELQGSQLFLYIANNAGSLLWASKPDDESDPHSNTYLARLDADGTLAVYRIQALVFQRLWLSRIWKQTILATEPNSLLSTSCELFWSVVLGKRIRRTSSEGVTSETCIVAIGSPFGCVRVGRKLVQLLRNAKAFVERLFSILDRLLDMI